MEYRHPKKLLASTALSLSLACMPALAEGPANGTVSAGSASIANPALDTTRINQFSNRAVIDWQKFHVSEDHTVTFNQPSAQAVILNRVNSGEPSKILGTINANGTVMLVNPDGILFGKNSKIDVGGLLATTHDITNDNFMAGNYIFDQSGKSSSASIVNQGTISATDGGIAAFVAPGVRNDGVISARLGKVGLSSANKFTLDLYGDNLIKLAIDDEIIDQVIDLATGQPIKSLVENSGSISAHGGSVALTAVTARRVVDHVINNNGIIEANSVGKRNGKIVLGAQSSVTKTTQAPTQNVQISGEIRANGDQSGQTGGNIHILGEMIGLTRATIEANGTAGGGTVLLGGDIQGGNASAETLTRYGIALEDQYIPTANTVSVDRDSYLSASATKDGNGGKIIAWADDTMDFQGTLGATGGTKSGNGGFAEVSGLKTLNFDEIQVDLKAANPYGSSGTILFDPTTQVINSASANALINILNGGANASVLADYIYVNSNIIKTSGDDATLGLFGNDGVTLSNGITIGSSSGKLSVFIDADFNDDGGVNFLQSAMDDYGRDLHAEVADFAADPIAFALKIGRTDFLNYFNEIWPDTETVSYGDLAQRLFDKGYIDSTQLLAAQENSYLNNGASFFLNGGTLEAHDGNGTVSIEGATISENSDGLVGPFILNATVNPNEVIRKSYSGIYLTPEEQSLLDKLEELIQKITNSDLKPFEDDQLLPTEQAERFRQDHLNENSEAAIRLLANNIGNLGRVLPKELSLYFSAATEYSKLTNTEKQQLKKKLYQWIDHPISQTARTSINVLAEAAGRVVAIPAFAIGVTAAGYNEYSNDDISASARDGAIIADQAIIHGVDTIKKQNNEFFDWLQR